MVHSQQLKPVIEQQQINTSTNTNTNCGYKVAFTRLITAGINELFNLFVQHRGSLYLRLDGSSIEKDDLHQSQSFTTGPCSDLSLLGRDTITESTVNLIMWHPS